MKYIPLIVLLILLTIAGLAEAASSTSEGACSQITIGASLGTRTFKVEATTAVSPPCTASIGHTGSLQIDVNSGGSLTLLCDETLTGTAPPGQADANGIVIRGYKDNNGFPDGTIGSDIVWTQTFSLCTTQQSFTKYCTADGLVGGAPSYGTVRLYIQAIRTGVLTYNDASDSATDGTDTGWIGTYRCKPQPTTFTTVSEQNPWIGGDTIIGRVIVDSAPYNTGNTGTLDNECAGVETTNNGKAFTTTQVTDSNTVIGSASVWQTGCTILIEAKLTRKSAVSGWTGVDYAIWDQASPPSGVTFPAAATYTSSVLNRINTVSTTVTVKEGANTVTKVNRGESVTLGQGGWQHGDGSTVTDSAPATTWLNRASQYRVATDFPSASASWGASGNLQATLTASTSATITTGLSYHGMMEEFNTTARTDSVLLNWGNASSLLDVSASWTFDSINIAKTNNGANASSFTIGTDIEFVRVFGLKNAAGLAISGQDVMCQRTRPDLSLETAVDMGNTNGAGDTSSTNTQFQVNAPQGNWFMTCTATANSNSASYLITFGHISTFTADTIVTVKWNVTLQANNSQLVNITAIFSTYDPISDDIISIFPDENPKLSVDVFNPATSRYDTEYIDRQIMTRNDGSTSSSFFWKYYTTNTTLQDVYAFVAGNLTARPFVGGEGFHLPILSTTGEDMSGFCLRGTDPDTACVGNRYANATFQGQTKSNTTESYANSSLGFCHRTLGECNTGNFTGNFSGNFTGGEGNFTNFSGVFANGTVTLTQTPAQQSIPLLIFLTVIVGCIILGATYRPIIAYLGIILSVIAFLVASGTYIQVWRWVFVAMALLSFVTAWLSTQRER